MSAPPAEPDEGLSKGARTRLRILDAGARVLGERGYAATRLSDIAEVAGLQTGSLAFHFKSKHDLLEAVLRHGFDTGLDQVRNAVEVLGPAAGPAARVAAAIGEHLDALDARGDYASALLRTMDQFPADVRHRLRDLDRDYVDYWRSLLESARDAGELPARTDTALLARLALGALNAALGRPDLAPREHLVATVLMMLGFSTAAGP
jgi:AcrR family transcriptional regulator